MRKVTTSIAIATAVAATLSAPAMAAKRVAAPAARGPLAGQGAGRHHALPPGVTSAPRKPKGKAARALTSSFVNGVGAYCYGRTASQGGGGSMVVSVAQHASFGMPYGTQISWRPWVSWSNASGSGMFTNNGWRTYRVMANGNASSGQGTYINAQGQTVSVAGGTSAPGTSVSAAPIGIAPRTWARPVIQLYINGRYSLVDITPDHFSFPVSVSGDWCWFS